MLSKSLNSIFQDSINYLYRYPRSALKKINRFGGIADYLRMDRQRRLMEKAALKLPPALSYPAGYPIYFLTGRRYLYQTLYCIQSLVKVSKEKYCFTIVDDGTFDNALADVLRRQIPDVHLVMKDEVEYNLERVIPKTRYPVLNAKRKSYPHIKKLTDIHTLPIAGWKVVFDSDMLFWKEPEVLIKWLQGPFEPIHLIDCERSYGYPQGFMEHLRGSSLQRLVNVGVVGLNSELILWDLLEKWIIELEMHSGPSYYLEQALTAMLIGDTVSVSLDAKEYIVNPGKFVADNSTDVLHHYVDLSKKMYYTKAWKKVHQ